MLDPKELALHKALMKVLDDATFPLKAREVASFAEVYNWARDLPRTLKTREVKMREEIKKELEPKEEEPEQKEAE